MAGNRKTSIQFICFALATALVAASCGGSDQSASVEAVEAPERTLAIVDLDATTTTETTTETADDEAGDDTADPSEDGSGGEVPEPTGKSPAAPTKDQPAAEPKSQPNESQPAAAPAQETPKPAPVPNDGNTSSIEREIASLTNELRLNPNGRLKRSKPVNCDRTPIDPSTGQAKPAPALIFDSQVSTQMARDWSQQLTWAKMQSAQTAHRPNPGAIYSSLGISQRYSAENVAVATGTSTAMSMFIQWRDSDGHYCNLMSPSATHIGVGVVVKDSSKGLSTFGTQNFYA